MKVAGKIRGKFLISLNDQPAVREILKAFKVRQVTLLYSGSHPAAGDRKVARRELLISYY